jgi:hypothetical protein
MPVAQRPVNCHAVARLQTPTTNAEETRLASSWDALSSWSIRQL